MNESDVVNSEWPHVYRPGSGMVVFALHGTGGNEKEIVALAERVAPGATVLAPRGRVAENGAARWFRRESEGVFDVDDVIYRAHEVAAFIDWSLAEYRLAGVPVVAMGFSNGANMALALGMLHPELIPSVVAFSRMYPFGNRALPNDLGSSLFLLLNGTSDPMAPAASVDTLVETATAHGADVTRVSRDGGHGISHADLLEAERWVRSIQQP